MCATFNVSESTLKKFLGEFDLPELRETGDVFPSDKVAVVTDTRPIICKWGFTRNGKKSVLFNARAETVTQKPMFSQSFVRRRCAVPADGFYEWDGDKIKRYFARDDGTPFFLCGFYRKDADGERFVVLTKPSTAPVNEYHDRIPVIADENSMRGYLHDVDFASDFILRDASIRLCAAR